MAHRNTSALLKPPAVSGPHCAWLPDTWQSQPTPGPGAASPHPLLRSSLCAEMGLGKPAEHLQPRCSKLPSVWLLALNQEWKLVHWTVGGGGTVPQGSSQIPLVKMGFHNPTRLLQNTCFCENATYILLLVSTWQVRLSHTLRQLPEEKFRGLSFHQLPSVQRRILSFHVLKAFQWAVYVGAAADVREDCHLATGIWGKQPTSTSPNKENASESSKIFQGSISHIWKKPA